jgi:hypothetical protein
MITVRCLPRKHDSIIVGFIRPKNGCISKSTFMRLLRKAHANGAEEIYIRTVDRKGSGLIRVTNEENQTIYYL